MNFIPKTLALFFATFALGANISHVVSAKEDAHRTLLRTSSHDHQQAPPEAGKKDAALPSSRRRLVDESMMPLEGYSVSCQDDPGLVYRWGEGQLRHYPNGQIAQSWDSEWRNVAYVDCTGIPIGPPMSLNTMKASFGRTSVMFTPARQVTVGQDDDVCTVLQNLPRREITPDQKCAAAQWADNYFKTNHPIVKDQLATKFESLDVAVADPVVCIAACVTVLTACIAGCFVFGPFFEICDIACVSAEAICEVACS